MRAVYLGQFRDQPTYKAKHIDVNYVQYNIHGSIHDEPLQAATTKISQKTSVTFVLNASQ